MSLFSCILPYHYTIFHLTDTISSIHKHATCIIPHSLSYNQFAWPLAASGPLFQSQPQHHSFTLVSSVHSNFLNQQRATRVISIETLLPPYAHALLVHFLLEPVCHPWRPTFCVPDTELIYCYYIALYGFVIWLLFTIAVVGLVFTSKTFFLVKEHTFFSQWTIRT